MKNKGLMIAEAVLVIGLVGYGFSKGTRSEKAATNDSGAKKETYRVGVLQLVKVIQLWTRFMKASKKVWLTRLGRR